MKDDDCRKLKIKHNYLNRENRTKTLDTNLLNAMTVITSQTNKKFFPAKRSWIVFYVGNKSIFRCIQFSRYFKEGEEIICVDSILSRRLMIEDGDYVFYRKMNLIDRMNVKTWMESLPPIQKIAFWYCFYGVICSSFLGSLIGALFSKLF